MRPPVMLVLQFHAEQALLVHGDETHWEVVAVPQATARTFTGVWGSGPDDVWVVGYSSAVAHHFDGTGWTASTLPSDARYARGIAGASPTELCLATTNGLFQGNGTTWSATSSAAGNPLTMTTSARGARARRSAKTRVPAGSRSGCSLTRTSIGEFGVVVWVALTVGSANTGSPT